MERINGEDETTELDDEEETFAPEDSFFDVDCDKMDIWNVAKVCGYLLNPGWTS